MGFRRYLAAGGVMALGVAAAAPFYHSPPPNGGDSLAAASPRRELPVLQHGRPSVGENHAGGTVSSGAASGASATVSDRVSLGSPQVARRSRPEQNTPPRMASSFTDAVGSSLRWANRATTLPAVAGQVQPQRNTTEAHGQPSAPTGGSVRFHTLRDGDTLALVSQRYYGSPDFAGFLFAQNRDVLRSPDLLPIGARLRIPPTPHALAPPQTGQPSRHDPSELVPVAWN